MHYVNHYCLSFSLQIKAFATLYVFMVMQIKLVPEVVVVVVVVVVLMSMYLKECWLLLTTGSLDKLPSWYLSYYTIL